MPLAGQRVAKVMAPLGKFRPQADHLLKRRDRPVKVARVLQRVAQVEIRLHVVGLQFQRAPALRRRLVRPAGFAQRIG